MAKTLSKNITFYIGAITMFVAGVLYMLMSDLTFNNNSYDLIVAVLLSFGSAILFFFSLNFNEKPKIMYLLKGIGLALGIGFVIYIHFYQTGFSLGHIADPEKLKTFPEIIADFQKAGLAKAKDIATSQATIIVALVLGYIALAAQIVNTVLVAAVKED